MQVVLPPPAWVRTRFFLARFELFWPLCGPALLAEVDEAPDRSRPRSARMHPIMIRAHTRRDQGTSGTVICLMSVSRMGR